MWNSQIDSCAHTPHTHTHLYSRALSHIHTLTSANKNRVFFCSLGHCLSVDGKRKWISFIVFQFVICVSSVCCCRGKKLFDSRPRTHEHRQKQSESKSRDFCEIHKQYSVTQTIFGGNCVVQSECKEKHIALVCENNGCTDYADNRPKHRRKRRQVQ